jgi:hypothetical protein
MYALSRHRRFADENQTPMKTKTGYTLTVLLCLFSFGMLMAQEGQTLRGTIIDEASRAPLPGVSVMVEGSNPALASASDIDGNYRIKGVPLGRHTIKVSYLGYETQTIPNVIITAGKEAIINITLTESVSKLNEVTIVYDRTKDKTVTNNEMTTVSSRSFNIEDTKRYAGSLSDPSRMAANYAGVIAGNDSRNDIVVRGNSPTGMLWQLEGINIPNPNHFGTVTSTGGPVSMLNNNNLDKSDFLTSAFPAQYGNAISGVFDLRMREGNNEKRELMAQMGFNGLEAGAEGPLSSNHRGSYIINLRYSTLSIFKKLGLNVGAGNAVPEYQDINAKVVLPTRNNKGKLSLFLMGGNSRADFLGQDVDTSKVDFYGRIDQNQYANFRTGITGISYEQLIGTKTNMKLTLAASSAGQYFDMDSIDLSNPEKKVYYKQKAAFTNRKYSAVWSMNHKINARNTLVAGANYDLLDVDLFNEFVFVSTPFELVNIRKQSSLTQGFAQWKHRFSNRLSLNTGIHTQHFSQTNQWVAEPRIGAKWLLNEKSSLNAGIGLHHQLPVLYNYYVQSEGPNGLEMTNSKLGFIRSMHYVLGYDINLTADVRIKAEIYYQNLSQVPVTSTSSSHSALNDGTDFNPSNITNLVNKGTGRNYGIEFTLERFFSKGFYYLVTASVFDSKYKGSDGIERNTAFNTRYAGNILLGKEFNLRKSSCIAFNIRSTLIGGKYLTPLDLEASRMAGVAVFDQSRAFSQKQIDYFRFDIKISYRKDFAHSTLETGLDLQNLTNRQNIFQQGYNRFNNSISTQYQTGLLPIPFVKFTF